MFVLKLPLFSLAYTVKKSAAISKLTYIWTTSSRSYIVLALKTQSIFEAEEAVASKKRPHEPLLHVSIEVLLRNEDSFQLDWDIKHV